MQFEFVEQGRQSGNPQLALFPKPIFTTAVLKLRHRHLPFSVGSVHSSHHLAFIRLVSVGPTSLFRAAARQAPAGSARVFWRPLRLLQIHRKGEGFRFPEREPPLRGSIAAAGIRPGGPKIGAMAVPIVAAAFRTHHHHRSDWVWAPFSRISASPAPSSRARWYQNNARARSP